MSMRVYIFLLGLFFITSSGASELSFEQGNTQRVIARQAVNLGTNELAPDVRIRAISFRTDGPWYGEIFMGAVGNHRVWRSWAMSGGWRSAGRVFVQASAGVAYVDNVTYTLTKHFQYLLSTHIGVRHNGVAILAGYRHWSNGQGLGKAKYSNLGEDFFTIGLAVDF